MRNGFRKSRCKKFDTSGKSPAYIQHQEFLARAGKQVAGFLNPAVAAFR
jgi:hypothetical protein